MKTLVIFSAALALSVPVLLRAADITGKWNSDFDTQIGHLKYTYELKADGNKLAGKAIRTLEERKTVTEISEGKVNGDDVSFVESLKFQGQDIRIEYKGRIAGDEIKFTRKVGDFATTEIVAKREKEIVPAVPVVVAGRWRAEFDTQIGKQKYIYDFKADGNKLTGKAIGDIAGEKSDTEIRDGRISGAEISFVEMVKFQGLEIRVDYSGKISGDEIKLTRQVGDVATEELVAKRVKESEGK